MCRIFLFVCLVSFCLVAVTQANSTLQGLEKRLNDLDTIVRRNHEEIKSLQMENKLMRNIIRSLEGQLPNFDEKIHTRPHPDCIHEDAFSCKKQFVGFYAKVSVKQSLSPNEVIAFKDVRYNKGGHYNGRTSMFTCPDDGVYAFFVSILSAEISRNTYVRWKIVRNGFSLTTGHTGYGTVVNKIMPRWGSAVSGSQMVIADCRTGQKIWVAAWIIHVNEERNNMLTYHEYSSFAGYKLV